MSRDGDERGEGKTLVGHDELYWKHKSFVWLESEVAEKKRIHDEMGDT